MRTFTYSSPTGYTIDLNDPDGILIGQIRELRSRVWSYELGSRKASGITREAREANATALILDRAKLDHAQQVFDADMLAETPGALEVDGWKTPAYISGSKPDSVHPQLTQIDYTIVLLGLWRRSTVTHFLYRDSVDDAWLDYPHDYPLDFMGMALGSTVSNDSLAPMPVKLTVFGPISNPYIVIGANRYQVNVGVPAGARLEIDGASEPKSVTLIRANGEHVNVFANAIRGTGKGSGSYVFEPLAPGVSGVTWAGQFDWDLEAFEERSEPPWI